MTNFQNTKPLDELTPQKASRADTEALIPALMAKASGSKTADRDTATSTSTSSRASETISHRLIGAILSEKANLSAEKVEQILAYAQRNHLRFGDAAVALGLVSQDHVLQALAEQFRYAYASEERRKISPELVGLNQPFSLQSEAIREIRSQLMMKVFVEGKKPKCALAVVSPASADGKTFFSANLAIAMAQLGGRALIVDADLRGPRQHQVFNVDNSTGLSSVLAGHVDSRVIQQVADTPGLFIMPGGVTPPNPLELIERPIFALLMRELTLKFDYVIVDTPAAIYGADAQVIAARCGAALVVARKTESRVGALQKLVATLSGSTAQVAGVIMNEF